MSSNSPWKDCGFLIALKPFDWRCTWSWTKWERHAVLHVGPLRLELFGPWVAS